MTLSEKYLKKAGDLLLLARKWRGRSPVWSGGDRAYLDVEMHRLFRRIELFEKMWDLTEEETGHLRRAEIVLEELSVLLWG